MLYYKIHVVGPQGGRRYYVKTTDFTLVELLDLLQYSYLMKKGYTISVSFRKSSRILDPRRSLNLLSMEEVYMKLLLS